MRRLAPTVNRIVAALIAAALAFAPVTPAFADCPASPMKMHTAAAPAAMPCDAPCKDCSSGAMKKACAGECVCTVAVFAHIASAQFDRLVWDAVEPRETAAPISLTHPPDTPPPRLLA